MKIKFIKVWYDGPCRGTIPFIVMQVEECDKMMIDAHFNPGYKIIIQAVYKQIGAAGGNSFNPFHGENVQKLSKKIEVNEADVLGYYLDSVEDISSIPTELHTKEFWDVLATSQDNGDVEEDDTRSEDCYKALITSNFQSAGETIDFLQMQLKNCGLDDVLEQMKKPFEQHHYDLYNPTRSLSLELFSKATLEKISSRQSYPSSHLIADFLWMPNEELPDELWEECQSVNQYFGKRVYHLSEEKFLP